MVKTNQNPVTVTGNQIKITVWGKNGIRKTAYCKSELLMANLTLLKLYKIKFHVGDRPEYKNGNDLWDAYTDGKISIDKLMGGKEG